MEEIQLAFHIAFVRALENWVADLRTKDESNFRYVLAGIRNEINSDYGCPCPKWEK